MCISMAPKCIDPKNLQIHHAEGLSAQDDNGKSDPYVVIAYSKFGKPVR